MWPWITSEVILHIYIQQIELLTGNESISERFALESLFFFASSYKQIVMILFEMKGIN